MYCLNLALVILVIAGLSGCQREVVAREASEGQRAILFASSRAGQAWTPSQFSSIAGQAAPPNACEQQIAEALKPEVLVSWPAAFTERQQAEARRLRPVFGRYQDVSAMPNDTAVRAAAVVDPEIALILACSAGMDAPRKRGKLAGQTCLKARCKAIDRNSRRRIVTADVGRCEPLSAEEPARSRTMSQLCSDVGRNLAQHLAALQGGPGR